VKWVKKGIIFAPDNNHDWMVSHASIPFVDAAGEGVWRIYFGTRDRQGHSQPAFIDVEAGNPGNILSLSERPFLPLGPLGSFDDSGIMPCWIVNHAGKKYLYYIGWNPQVTVSYRLSIGLAISEDGGQTYKKYADGPICDRSVDEPYFNTAPCVLLEGEQWKMWYVSCTKWEIINDWPEPFYHVKYAESLDGAHWKKTGLVCINYDGFTEAIGRPCVFRENGLYKMLYSFRSATDYRKSPEQSYRLGYAESRDGISWTRKDDEVGIERSQDGWDSQMMQYCHIYEYRGKKYLFYNGNEFGKSGIGYAILEEE
jgi:hypothetical protein